MIMMMLDLAERHEADAYEDESGEPYHVGGDTAAGQLEWVDDVEKAEAENMDAEGLASFLSDHHVQERGTFTFRLVTSGIMIETSGVFMINTTSGRIVALRERRNRTENYHHSHRKYCNQKAQAITRLFSWMHVISGFHTHPAGNTWSTQDQNAVNDPSNNPFPAEVVISLGRRTTWKDGWFTTSVVVRD
ncbi:MAG: hypothetical protein IPM29_17325 [Planctomycetes bacterium]|nr:hypothetical protein [Planctomycetota bacterium]